MKYNKDLCKETFVPGVLKLFGPITGSGKVDNSEYIGNLGTVGVFLKCNC